MTDQVAVFIDWENIAISATQVYGRCELTPIIKAAERWGRCIIRRAYGDWTQFGQYKQDLISHSIDLVQLFRYGMQQRKNAADIQMVVDAVETALTHPDIGTFVIATGDSDFSAVARKLRAYGKQVIGIGLRQSTSEVLTRACDQFILYDTLIESDARTTAFMRDHSRQLLLDTMRSLQPVFGQSGILAAKLKQEMLAQDPTFDEVALGYSQFKEFLEAQADLVQLIPREGTDMVVTLAPVTEQGVSEDKSASYRAALDAAGLGVRYPHTRSEILRDLFRLLSERPGELSLEEAVSQLKAKYDTTNILRSREEVQDAAKLLRYADVLDPKPESWELDCLTLKSGLQAQEMVDQCESVFLAVLLQNNLEIDAERVSLLLFDTVDQRTRVEELMGLALAGAARPVVGRDWSSLRETAELEIVFQELQERPLDQQPTLGRAHELADQGLDIRTKDFRGASQLFLQAARMIYELLERGEPGASMTDLKWYLASYCSTTAGFNYLYHNLPTAWDYYLAFFSLARETDPVWDKVYRLAPRMLSYYFASAAGENQERLDAQPGTTLPVQMAVLLCTHANPKVKETWRELVRSLARVNPAMVRTLIQQLDEMDRMVGSAGAREARSVLAELVS